MLADTEPELIKAVREGCLDKVGELVAKGIDVNCEDADGNSALHHAILANNVLVLRLLLATHKCNVCFFISCNNFLFYRMCSHCFLMLPTE